MASGTLKAPSFLQYLRTSADLTERERPVEHLNLRRGRAEWDPFSAVKKEEVLGVGKRERTTFSGDN